jgi:hypothetical protein
MLFKLNQMAVPPVIAAVVLWGCNLNKEVSKHGEVLAGVDSWRASHNQMTEKYTKEVEVLRDNYNSLKLDLANVRSDITRSSERLTEVIGNSRVSSDRMERIYADMTTGFTSLREKLIQYQINVDNLLEGKKE